MAQLWVRAEENTNSTISTSGIGQTDFAVKEFPGQIYREHLHAEVKARMSRCATTYAQGAETALCFLKGPDQV